MPRHDDTRPASATLDTRGLLCPLPVLLSVREIAKLPPGGRLIVEGDDPGMLEDLPAWCELNGHRLVEIGYVEDGEDGEDGGAGEDGEDGGVAEEAGLVEAVDASDGLEEPEPAPLIRAVIEKAADP